MPASAAIPAADAPNLERVRINFSWMLKLRWAAAAGQLAAIMLVVVWLKIDLRLNALFAILWIEALSNIAIAAWFRAVLKRQEAPAAKARRLERVLGAVMLTDIVLLTALLYVTGGTTNPFAVFYIVNIVLSAVVLGPNWTLAVSLLALVGYALLLVFYLPLPAMFAPGAGRSLYDRGVPIALGMAAVVVAVFMARITKELHAQEGELQLARARKARAERIEALGTLAAGAAHELSSPLSTIAVAAKDLEIALERSGAGEADDARLIRREVGRCRAILDQMAVDAGQMTGAEIIPTTIDELIGAALADLRRADAVSTVVDARCREQPLLAPRRALALALRQIVKNALDASPGDARVRVDVGRDDQHLVFEVSDSGSGMDSAILARATDPFFTTKEPGRGMGLGLFLAQTVVERLDGRLQFDSAPGRGTQVRVELPWKRLWPAGAPGAERSRQA